MHHNELIKQIDFLLNTALRKCGNPEEAQDLTQDTLMAALKYLADGHEIKDIKAFLLGVLNRRFYDSLRKKYKLPILYTDNIPDIEDEFNGCEEVSISEEGEELRRQIAFLTKLYRDVIIRHYMYGESIEQIARELNIPTGTVKSRLSTGREHIKKGFDSMESYTQQSYEPITLHIANSGLGGINDEPYTLVAGDLIAQNLLYLAYWEPVTEAELSKAIGIPLAYVEPIIKKLTDGELMKRTGNKVYTDFMISTINDREKYIPAQKKLAEEHFQLFWEPAKQGLEKIRKESFYLKLSANQQQALELYYIFCNYDYGLYRTFSDIYQAQQHFPDRPNGGRWIAFGSVNPQNYNYRDHMLHRYGYAGERHVHLNGFLGKNAKLDVYDPSGFPCKIYHTNEFRIEDDDLAKLLLMLHEGINPEETGFNIELLKAIPWLCECRILNNSCSKPVLDIPVLTFNELKRLREIIDDSISLLKVSITPVMREYYDGKNQPLPKHLTSVPLQKQYMHAGGALLFIILRLAIKNGLIYDGDYDNKVQCPYPMLLAIDK